MALSRAALLLPKPENGVLARPGAQHVQLGLAHRSFEAEQQTVVEQRRMIDAVSISDQCVGQPGEIDEAVPVGVVASEARHLEPKNKPDAGECDLGGEARKAGARDRAGARETDILVDDDDAFIRPAELASFGGECILSLRQFAIVLDLRRARLTQIDDSLARVMARRDLRALIHVPAPLSARLRSRVR